MNILTYTNGVGHLIMSILLILVGVLLIIYPGLSSDAHGIGIGLIMTVTSAWFIPGAAKQVIYQAQKSIPQGTPQVTPQGEPQP